MIIEFKDEIEKIRDIRNGKIREGYKLENEKIDEHFRFKSGNFNVILGHANVGKTSLVLYLMLLHSLKNGLRLTHKFLILQILQQKRNKVHHLKSMFLELCHIL